MKKILLFIPLFLSITVNAQIAKKNSTAKRVANPPKIDGVLDDDAWKNIQIATDFVMLRPQSGTPAPVNLKTEVKIVYDDNAIYFGAYLYDDKPKEIPMEFQTRDKFGKADYFSVVLNPSNDGQNQTEFYVMSAGNQIDAKVLPNGRKDFSWNAIWESNVSLTDNGWIVEIKIPYTALNFSNDAIQTWAINFHRSIRKTRDEYTWNFIPRNQGVDAQYDGILTGLKNIKSPLRLSFNPYTSSTATSFAGKTQFDWSVGMDIRYGINDNFTFNATLIPDFGQTKFDNVILNLGPFEQRFSEKRAFFNEGTDLFSKGNLFYSRRVGSAPIGRKNIATTDDEEIINNPKKVNLLNAFKISGRNKNGLGIGVFNGITEKTMATVKNTRTNNIRKVTTEPLANYNMLVFDQQFNKNSSITLINTNVIRNGSFRDANVTGLLYNIKTKDNKYGVKGDVVTSNIFEGSGKKPITGLKGFVEIGKISGKHQYDLNVEFKNKRFDVNDLAFQRTNNNLNISSSFSIRQIEPKGILNNFGLYFWGKLKYLMENDKTSPSFLEKSNTYVGNNFGAKSWFTTKKYLSFGATFKTQFKSQYDYFEPRVAGRFYKRNPLTNVNAWFSSNFNKQFALSGNFGKKYTFNQPEKNTNFSLSPRYRVNNQLTLECSFKYNEDKNQIGYVTTNDDAIIFGNRNSKSITNTLTSQYNFNTKNSLSLSVRQYWSPVKYKPQYYKLENNGTITNSTYTDNNDVNLNTWNLDLNYSWEFAPGSQLTALYRNNAFNLDNNAYLNFNKNIKNLFNEDLQHTVSLKVIYYLDYNTLLSNKRKKKNFI